MLALVCLCAGAARAAEISGTVRDVSGGVLPGVTVDVRRAATTRTAVTDEQGSYRIDGLEGGRYQMAFSLINFATVRREIDVQASTRVDIVLPLALNADVTVTGKRTFANLADVENPAENLVGIAQSASQGAVTARQLDERPLMRDAEVLETVPGVIVTQHSGEGKANQYFLRGFNLDHGTDFATTVAGMPVNLPTHAHGQGYTDLNFLIPELVTGVQFSKGPYYADQGDFATAGSSNINYANVLDKPIAHVEIGGEGYERALFAASPAAAGGHLVAALEASHNDGPWQHPDAFHKLNAVLRYSRGDSINGFSLTALGYRGTWNSTDQVPLRAVTSGAIGRFGAIDPRDGGDTYRYGGIADWQRASRDGEASTRVTGYAVAYDLHLFSDFTFALDDPVHGDQIEQADHRVTYGGKITHRRASRWGDKAVQNTFGFQLRTDAIADVALYHTEARVRLETESQASVVETQSGAFAQNEVEWTPWLRTIAGIRADAAWFVVDDLLTSRNSGRSDAALVSPKAGMTLGPWRGTELYVNAGTGFHSNDARGTTVTTNADGTPAQRATPLVRAEGAEIGVRTVAVPHVQTTLSVWTLRLASELVFAGDAGTTEASRASRRSGVEFANYYSPRKWLVFDGDLSWSRARFAAHDPSGDYVPEAVGTVVSAGAAIDGYKRMFGSLRWRYFGPRALVADASVESTATSLWNLQAGYAVSAHAKIAVDVFNLLNAADSDIDYFYVSRLPGEPAAGIADLHTHPTLPRTARASLVLSF